MLMSWQCNAMPFSMPQLCSRVVVAAFFTLLCCTCIWPAGPFAIIALGYAFKVRIITKYSDTLMIKA